MEAAGALAAILILGLAFRLIIAYVLLPGSGFGVDRTTFQAWAGDLAANGPLGFYSRGFFADYTPGYLYVLWLIGIVGHALGGIGDLIKLPAIVADVAIAGLIHSFVRELGGSRRAALIGAILFLFNPVTWFDSAIWAQVDSVGVVFLLLGLRDLCRRRPERASFFAVVAAIVKPQLGILVPIVAIVLLRRHVYDQFRPAAVTAAEEDPATLLPSGASRDPWFDRLGGGPIRLVSSAAVALVTAVVLCLPFGLSLGGLLELVAKAAGGYPYITVNAYNPWALLSQDGNGLAANGTWLRDAAGATADQVATLVGGLPAVYVGTALLLAGIAVVCLVVARWSRPGTLTIDEGEASPVRVLADERRLLVVALTVMALVFFVLPTRVHERYLYPAFAVGAILAATSIRWRIAYIGLALASFANLYAILLTPFYKNPGIKDWLGIGDAIRSPLGVGLIVAGHVAVFVWALTELRPQAIRRLDVETLRDALWEREGDAAELVDWEGSAAPAPADVPYSTAPASGAAPAAWAAARASGQDPSGGLPLPFGLGAVRARLADRSRGLHGEGGGRFDRLDLWLFVVIVVASLVLRTFRLSEPYRMHFDEVYHARTATEFLQDWRYGKPHDIYEFTHPHLAKYAMAVGLIVAGDDRVTAQSSLGTAVRDVLVEPRWVDANTPGGRAGERFYVAGGDQLVAYDLVSRKEITAWAVPGRASWPSIPSPIGSWSERTAARCSRSRRRSSTSCGPAAPAARRPSSPGRRRWPMPDPRSCAWP